MKVNINNKTKKQLFYFLFNKNSQEFEETEDFYNYYLEFMAEYDGDFNKIKSDSIIENFVTNYLEAKTGLIIKLVQLEEFDYQKIYDLSFPAEAINDMVIFEINVGLNKNIYFKVWEDMKDEVLEYFDTFFPNIYRIGRVDSYIGEFEEIEEN